MISTNPFAQRLAHNGGPFSGVKAFYACLGSGFLISLITLIDVAFSPMPASGIDGFQVFVFVIGFSIIISLPLFMTYVATAVTVTYTKSSEFPFLLLTNLPAKAIVQGFLIGTFYRCRVLVALVISLSIALSIPMKSGGFQFSLYPETLGYGIAESMVRHIVMGFLFAAIISSICLLGASIGIMLGLWWRQTIIANGAATILLIIGAFWWLDKTGDFLVSTGSYYSNLYTYDVLHILLYIPLPIMLSWILLRIARRWTRNP
ncbi:MAG: hypothetical protein GY796_06195 [Chloroflexi bacterium]|nr:hypothetical protein [Chloroflexota bacterium]